MMNGAKAIAKKYNEVSLILRIVVGLVIGAVLALAVPLPVIPLRMWMFP